jgi:hypothetical protein
LQYLKVTLFLVLFTGFVHSKDLSYVVVDDDDVIISSIVLNKQRLVGSVDAYKIDQHFLVAIDPLFNMLKLKYQLLDSRLIIWKNDEQYVYNFKKEKNSAEEMLWSQDSYYKFIDLRELKSLFGLTTAFDTHNLSLEINTKDFQFPITVLADTEQSRLLKKLTSRYANGNKTEQLEITIPDQYKLFTLPHGRLTANLANDSDNNTNYSLSSNIVADFLYHSMSLNLNKSKDSDLTGSLSLSKFKASPSDNVLGIFDQYTVGDISSFSSDLVTNTGRGVGFSTKKAPFGYRRSNDEITIEENGPPGWEVELYRNNTYIDSMIIPDSGSIIFSNVLIEWGNNNYEIRLYGPYGEKEIIEQTYQLDSNPLGKGDSAYGVYVFDPNKTLFGDEENSPIKLNNAGGYIDYGISDKWQVGVGFNQIGNSSQTQGDEQVVSIKNYLSLPGLLLENDFAVNHDSGYAQETTLIGNVFNEGTFGLSYLSSDNFKSARIRSLEKIEQVRLSYSNRYGYIPYGFTYQHRVDAVTEERTLSNRISYSQSGLNISHYLNYSQTNNGVKSDLLLGRANIATSIFDKIRLSASLSYNPEENFEIQDSSSLSAQYNYKTNIGIQHNVNFQYRPLAATGGRWNANYNISWDSDDYRLSFNSSYSEDNRWSLGLYMSFFLGYDYHNNRAIMSNNVSSSSATLNVDTYLDRHLNGYRDSLDYPLEGVSFKGNRAWENILSNENGRTILPGVAANSTFRFSADWVDGSQAINNNYVIYTHPGATVDVNMPFYLQTEFSGYVYKIKTNFDLPVQGIELLLIDKNGDITARQNTDRDGYYEFLNVKPNSYYLVVNKESLKKASLTGDNIGFNINTPASGGYAVLPDILLEAKSNINEQGKEAIIELDTEKLFEPIIWEEDKELRKNYFLMPLKNKSIAADYVTRNKNEIPSEKSKNAVNIKNMAKLNGEIPLENNNLDGIKSIADLQSDNIKKASNESPFYSIQLAAFSSIDKANKFINNMTFNYPELAVVEIKKRKAQLKTIVKVVIGQFTTAEQALDESIELGLQPDSFFVVKLNEAEISGNKLVSKNVEELGPIQPLENNNDGWVVQLSAGKYPIQQDKIAQFPNAIQLYQAVKTVNNEEYHCIITRRLETKSEALNFIAINKLSGWAVEFKKYGSVIGVSRND